MVLLGENLTWFSDLTEIQIGTYQVLGESSVSVEQR